MATVWPESDTETPSDGPPMVVAGAGPYEGNSKLGVPLLEQVWRAVWNNKWIVAGVMALCIVAGLIITLLSTPLYTASSLIEISRQQENVSGVEAVEQQDKSRDQEFYETQYALLRARSLADRVVRDLNLAGNEDFFAAVGVSTQTENGSAEQLDANERARQADRAASLLLRNVSVNPVRGSSLVNIGFTSADPQISAQVANSWVQQFIEADLARRFASTDDAREFLQDQLAKLRKRLEESESALVNYATTKEIVTLSEKQDADGRTTTRQTLAEDDLQRMNAELTDARSARIAAESAMRQGRGARETLSNSTINGLRQQRATVAAERARLMTTFEPQYPAVEALTSQLRDLDRSIAQEEARVRSASSSGYNEALQRENELAAQVQALKARVAGQNRDSIQFNIYQREVDTNRQLYDGLLQRYKEIGVAGVGSSNIAVVDVADVPKVPSSPNLLLNLALSILAGLAISAVYIFAREQIDQTLRDPADVRNLLGLTPLGSIPDLEKEEVLVALQDSKSIASEAYFSIGTSLSFLTEHGVPRSMVFTSTQPNEGKSTSAYGLSQMLARTGRRVVLVDADMRNPSVHKMFELSNAAGLSNFLAGEDDLVTFVRATDRSELSIMTAGPIPPNPAELLSGDRFKLLVERLGKEFDHILIDAPPVLGLADVPLIASHVEGLIFNIEANQAKLRSIQAALQRIRASNVPIFGAIVTKLDARNASYGYGYGYGYGYTYGGGDEAKI